MLRIEATPIGGGQAFVIAAGTGARGDGAKEVMNDIEGSFDAMVRRATLLEGPQEQWLEEASANYNEFGDMPLTVDYQFDNSAAGIAACFQFWSRLQWTVPVLANLVITAANASATIPRVKLRPLRFRTQGEVAVQVVYPISFGLITNSAVQN